MIEPVAVWSIAKAAGEISKKLYDLGKGLKDRDLKHQIDEIVDKLRELKQSASDLEDQNRELREKLRFKSDDFQYRAPFWYEKAHPDRDLCPKCFANKIIAPMDGRGMGVSHDYRICLVCNNAIEVKYR